MITHAMGTYIYLIHEKLDSLHMFKIFRAEVETQLSNKIKCVRSDRGGEYYDRYDGSGEQRPGPFADFLKEYGIVSQYTMPGSPSMNGVAERRNTVSYTHLTLPTIYSV